MSKWFLSALSEWRCNAVGSGPLAQGTQLHSHLSFPQLLISPYKLKLFSVLPLLYCSYIALQLLNLQDICDASAGCSYSYFESKGLHKWKLHSTHPLHWPKRLKFWKVQCYSPISASCKVNTGISKTYLCPISECIILSSWKYFFFFMIYLTLHYL